MMMYRTRRSLRSAPCALGIEIEDYRHHVFELATMLETFGSAVLERWVDGDSLAVIEGNEVRPRSKRRAVCVVNGLIVLGALTWAATLAVRF